jgi:amino acid transporter
LGSTERGNEAQSNKFGTFGGVFTPSILTIFGVIMFMRANYVTGQAGILNAILILVLCQLITLITTFSVGAISTNIPIKGGGAYFMVSRVLGSEFGGAIGITLFLAQVVSISFYMLGFSEAVVKAFPHFSPYFLQIGLIASATLFTIALFGAELAIKTQYFIMAVLFCSIVAFLGGAVDNFSVETLKANWHASPEMSVKYGFWGLYAIYFPSVTGFIAGINMSGDLKNPGKSMTRGTLYALAVSFIVYLLQILLYGGGFARSSLVQAPFTTMLDNAVGGASFLVVAGVYAATLSSALGRFVGAPRILQAISVDEIVPFLGPFGKGYGPTNEPRLALVFCGVCTAILLFLGGDGSGGAFLDSIAAVMGMFFLYTFGLLNYAAFVEGFSQNPSFRPRFKFFHWSIALLGVILSVGSAFLVDPYAASIASIVLIALVAYLRGRKMKISFGDVRRGFLYSRIRDNLLRLKEFKEDSRNWRPSIITLSGNPLRRETLVSYAVWLSAGRGLIVLCNLIIGPLVEGCVKRSMANNQLEKFLDEKNIQAFPHVFIAPDFDAGVSSLLQGISFGPLRPNILVYGWPSGDTTIERVLKISNVAACLKISQVIVIDRGVPEISRQKRIDVWWRGQKNGSLMMMLAHLLALNWEWSGTKIRLLRVVNNEAGRDPSYKALKTLISDARMQAKAEVIVSDEPFAKILRNNSEDADVVFLGFESPDEESKMRWYENYQNMLEGLPTSILIQSTQENNLLE